QNKMGHGSDELGQILIKGFIYSISQLEVVPNAVVFFNSGVKLTLQDANTLADIQSMVERGTIVRVCGTCTDYFKVKDQVAVGEICNMYDIVDAMSSAAKVINI
ncbi:MAG: sulfurtransferase-like selenium metabolism protein YedF, partial [Clostridia bacterium]|nr:sulfurtransferase-like selenium metabolism protein YedF [Clostridia bacterium]